MTIGTSLCTTFYSQPYLLSLLDYLTRYYICNSLSVNLIQHSCTFGFTTKVTFLSNVVTCFGLLVYTSGCQRLSFQKVSRTLQARNAQYIFQMESDRLLGTLSCVPVIIVLLLFHRCQLYRSEFFRKIVWYLGRQHNGIHMCRDNCKPTCTHDELLNY